MNKEEKPIYFLSASDRLNYGDLLFPIIFKKILKGSGYTFHNYGIVDSDLGAFGALPTRSYRKLLKDLKANPGKLVVGGGEVLFPEWSTLYAFIDNRYARLHRNTTFQKVERRLGIAQKILGGQNVPLPFSPPATLVSSEKIGIYYSSVGGQFYGSFEGKKNKNALEALRSATYISVRDQRTKDEMDRAGIPAELVPDSALIMSDYFSLDELKKRTSLAAEHYSGNYIFVQLGRYKGPENLEMFSKSLNRISKELGLRILLCPIGLAPGHEDDIILKELVTLNSDFTFVMPQSIYDIMLLIASSQFYLGTSLHGLITSQSYQVKHLAINRNIPKAEAYLKTWVDATLESADFNDVNYIVDTFKNWDTTTINNKTELQKQKVRQNLQHIISNL